MKVLHLEENHPALIEGLQALGFQNDLAYTDSLDEIMAKLDQYDGLIIRSKYPIDKTFLTQAKKLKFIGRVGAGLENIDVKAVESHNIHLINAPEGNRNAVGEHTLGMLLSLMNRLNAGHASIQSGQWDREGHRGWEVSGRTLGIIGYGNTGKSFAKKISGFDVNTLCYDILGMGDNWKTHAKNLAEKGYCVHLVDQRNHGRSFWSEVFDYDTMVEDLRVYMDHHGLDQVIL
ncbi:hypothetical protein N9X09_03910, partial [Flavobacteriaceae bacterium]|nr:hypothetical protein [Flavobacteriaceae bacterium]